MTSSFSNTALDGQVALVTGASRGIGASIAAALAAAGATVVGTATSQSGADGITAAYDGKVRGVVLNIADEESVAAALKDIQAHEGAPTVLVNNAGITRDNLLMRMKDDEWNDVIETDLSSLYRVCKAATRSMMKARQGRIVNIGSVVGATGNPGQSNYAAAKAGMIGFTRALARELGGRNITVNAVSPGFIDTDMTRALSDAQRESLLGQIPLRRLGDPADVAAAVLFLCSEQAAYITGEALNVSGGEEMH